MILKKPYAFFIKMFKPIHLILAALIAYLIFLENKILEFLSSYITTNVSVIGKEIRGEYASNFVYIIPIIIIFVSLVIFGIMFKKKKPTKFYLINIFAYIVVIIINVYTIKFLGTLEKNIVAIKIVKLIHDFVFVNIIIETISFIVFIIRGIGINLKKFDFDSELSNINISESDKEEFEVNIQIDLNESKRKRKKYLRNLKYLYFENKFIINVLFFIFLGLVTTIIITLNIRKNNQLKEGIEHIVSDFNFIVDRTIIIDKNYSGEKITDNYLIVVDTELMSYIYNKKLYLNDFSLNIGEAKFKPTTKYNEELVDIGPVYEETTLTNQYENYLFVYEIPEKYIKSEMIFEYNDKGVKANVSLNPSNLKTPKVEISKKIGENISFLETLGNIKFKINSININSKYLIEYDYCIKKEDCVKSYEYLKPKINENFDKNILKLDVEYLDNSSLEIMNFYDFFENFGSIYYCIEGSCKIQTNNFEEIKSLKRQEKNVVYIGVNSEISKASKIKFVFNIRNSKYEYVLK